MSTPPKRCWKIVILGEGRVGKTSILSKYFKNKFLENQQQTTSMSYHIKEINANGNTYTLNFWDTAGQEKYKAMTKSYYTGAVGAMIIYDANDFDGTFKKVKEWINDLKDNVDEKCCLLVIGNKMDLVDDKSPCFIKEHQEAERFCAVEGTKLLWTSAKTGQNIGEAFNQWINWVMNAHQGDFKTDYNQLDQNKGKDKIKKEGCC